MKECPQCGKGYSDNDKFCQICGGRLIELPMEEQPMPQPSEKKTPAPQAPAPGYQMAPPVKGEKKRKYRKAWNRCCSGGCVSIRGKSNCRAKRFLGGMAE